MAERMPCAERMIRALNSPDDLTGREMTIDVIAAWGDAGRSRLPLNHQSVATLRHALT